MEKIDNALVTPTSGKIENIGRVCPYRYNLVSYYQSANDEWIIPQNAG